MDKDFYYAAYHVRVGSRILAIPVGVEWQLQNFFMTYTKNENMFYDGDCVFDASMDEIDSPFVFIHDKIVTFLNTGGSMQNLMVFRDASGWYMLVEIGNVEILKGE